MKTILKNLPVIFYTVVLLLGAAFVATKESAQPLHFLIQNDSGQEAVSVFDAQDGNCYVFLPSYCELGQVTAVLPSGQELFLDDIRLSNEMSCGVFELEKPYDYFVDGEYIATLWFYRSRNVSSLFLDTVTGTMEDIHNDKTHEEYASMTLYLPDGSIDYQDRSSRLKGRGNSTWERDKRPYVLTLSTASDLLGMGNGKKWVLLANAYDETNLNNKLVFDIASQTNLGWSPDCRFVDLYLNGEYSGLYLLTEKIEVEDNRLDIDAGSGDFLCMLELLERKELLMQPFESSMGRTIEVCYPETASDEALDTIRTLVSRMEQEIASGTDLRDSEHFNLDSWARCYLIDEISGNIDADITSSYFYYSGDQFFAGPLWDYDMAFGNNYRNQEPNALIAKNARKGTHYHSPYYGALYDNDSFQRRVAEIYRSEFAPVLQKMIDRDLDDQCNQIQSASEMNSIRWRRMFDALINETSGTGIVRNTEDLKSYFCSRVRFLDRVWLENVDYCTVQFAEGSAGPYWNVSVEKGTCLETTYKDLKNTVWTDQKTGLLVDFQKPITQDLVVEPVLSQ